MTIVKLIILSTILLNGNIIFESFCLAANSLEASSRSLNNSSQNGMSGSVMINKCCERFEIHVDGACSQVNKTDYFKPQITGYNGEHNLAVPYEFVIGLPHCGSKQMWHVYQTSADELVILEDGKLRHYTKLQDVDEDYTFDESNDAPNHFYRDYEQGQYCIDRAISNVSHPKLYAGICLTQNPDAWKDANFIIKKVLNPILHGISLAILLIIAIIYFILPTLRDLVGNIVTTICICLMVQTAADLVRTFTEFTNHVSLILADIIMHTSVLASFLWLNSLGYYIWKTFRSRNVFLRVTDGRKYCYYSAYVWSLTTLLAGTSVFSHFYLDTDLPKTRTASPEDDSIGFLGRIVFFSPIGCTIIVNIFFFTTTLQLINRRNIYGRIQHKLKSNFVMFALMWLTMSVAYIFFIFASFNYDGFVYSHIIVSAIEMPLLLYICVIRQNHVTHLLKKSCCYQEPVSTTDWGDEMNYMNGNDY